MAGSPETILFYLPEEQEAEIREVFAKLAERGLPEQKQTPHITVTFSPKMDPDVVELAQELLPPLVPSQLRRVGTVVFGTKRKQTVAWLLEADEELEATARQLSAANPDGRGERWTPHITMGLRLPRETVPEYIKTIDEVTSPHLRYLTAERACYWRPQEKILRQFN